MHPTIGIIYGFIVMWIGIYLLSMVAKVILGCLVFFCNLTTAVINAAFFLGIKAIILMGFRFWIVILWIMTIATIYYSWTVRPQMVFFYIQPLNKWIAFNMVWRP